MAILNYDITINKSVFNEVYYPYLDDLTRIQIFFGGASSGKSVFLAQRLVRDLLKGERNYLCCRNVSKTIRSSCFTEIKKVITAWGLDKLFKINKSDMTITCISGYQVLFAGLDDVEKLKSIVPEKGVVTDIWVEEATECQRADIIQLTKRLRGQTRHRKRLTLSFNPIFRAHWLYKEYFSGAFYSKGQFHSDYILILKTTYKDNRFLEQDDRDALEAEKDSYFYQVYTLGNWGILGGLIFNNWTVADVLNDPIYKSFDGFRNGLDFGYSNDPTAFNRTYYHRATKKLYIVDEFTEKGITNDLIAAKLKSVIGQETVVCDCAEPKSIQELRNYGIFAEPANKGKDSVNHGIQWLKQQTVIIDKRCQSTINNFQMYHWKKDKHGEPLNVPVDKFNDHIDNIRYQYEDYMMGADDGVVEEVGESLAVAAAW